jgi:hypothetical protein
MRNRRRYAWAIVVTGTVLCLWWAYIWAAPIFAMAGQGSGGIGAVSGNVFEFGAELLWPLVPPASLWATFRLAKRSGARRLARNWRRAHVATTLVLIGALFPIASAFGFVGAGGLAAVFLPIQVWFAVGAIAIRIGSGRAEASVPSGPS